MKILLIISTVLLISACIFFIYYGGLIKITPVLSLSGGETLAYREVIGNYRQSGPVSNEIYDQLQKKIKLETFRGFGIYYDEPGKVEDEKLRSDVGCIIEKKDSDKINLIKNFLLVKTLPEKKYLTVEFPYRNPLSSLMGIFKVYPVLKKEAQKINPGFEGSVMEIWDIPQKKIFYRKEIE